MLLWQTIRLGELKKAKSGVGSTSSGRARERKPVETRDKVAPSVRWDPLVTDVENGRSVIAMMRPLSQLSTLRVVLLEKQPQSF